MTKARCMARCLVAAVITAATVCTDALEAATQAPPITSHLSFACSELSCGMPAKGSYPHLVVGTIVAVADASQARTLFEAMRKHGHWSALPPSTGLFWKNLQPVVIDAGPGVVMVTLTSQDEMHAAPLHVGDFVRYSPHRGKYETPPADKIAAAYWTVDGCVAVLCVAGDKPCVKRYAGGLFRFVDGAQLSPRTLKPFKHGMAIDVQSMLPRNAEQVK